MLGNPSLAKLIGQNPEYGIYRSFGELNARRILYLEDEINLLYVELDLDDQKNQSSTKICESEISRMAVSEARQEEGAAAFRYQRNKELFGKLEKYYQALRQTKEIAKFPRPEHSAIESLQSWLKQERGEKLIWREAEHDLYHSAHAHDLITTFESNAQDGFGVHLGKESASLPFLVVFPGRRERGLDVLVSTVAFVAITVILISSMNVGNRH